MDILSKDEFATILWALDSKMESILQDTKDEDRITQMKLCEQLNIVYHKIYDMWKSNDLENK